MTEDEIPGAGKQGVHSMDSLNDHFRGVAEVIEERRAQREAATSRRREIRAAQRRDFADARKVGLQRRHASRLREADTTRENT